MSSRVYVINDSNYSVVMRPNPSLGRRTTHNPFTSRDKPWDPYGVAKFDLSGLLLGQKFLHMRSPIQCCPLPDTYSGLQKPDGPIVGQPGNVDGPGMSLKKLLQVALAD